MGCPAAGAKGPGKEVIMKIAISTPTGNIGMAVADELLKKGADPILLARDVRKLHDLIERGAQVRQGTLEDEAFVKDATSGIDALFWVTPPDYASPDMRAFYRRLGRSAARAVKENRVSRVVNISSIGAELSEGNGPVAGLYDVEGMFNEVAENIVHLRCAYFFENYLFQLESMAESQSVFLPVPGWTKTPMIATRDIARVSVKTLLDESWSGRIVRELHGAEDLTFVEAAAEISEGLGRTINHVEVTPEAAKEAMKAAGLSESVADMLIELYGAISSGKLGPLEERSEYTTTSTRLSDFARDTLAGMIPAPAKV